MRTLAQKLDVGKSSVHKMLKKDLKMSKLIPRFIPKDLTDDQRRERVRVCQMNLDALKADDEFISKIITGDESWISVLELENKQASLEWLPRGIAPADRPEKSTASMCGKEEHVHSFFLPKRTCFD